MRIIDLHIVEFGSLKDLNLTIGKGLTVIYGENESGKSTLWSFIKFMLYGLPKRGSIERERAVSRDGHRAAGRMTVQVGEEIYQIDRSLVDGARAAEKVSVSRVRDGETVFAGQVPGEALLGVPKEVFENSCGIGQSLCSGINGKKEASAIQNLLTSADETVEIDKIVAKLEEIRVRYRYKKGTGGRLYELEREIHAQKGRLDEAIENHLRKTELACKLESGAKQLRLCEEKLSEAENMEKQIARMELLRRFDVMRENEKKAEELEKKIRESTFTLDDYLDQFEQIKKIGNMEQLVGMMPGVKPGALKDAKIDEKAIGRTEAIIKSMTRYEREKPDMINASRKKRIAAGSGTSVEEVNKLLRQYDQIRKLMKQFANPKAMSKMRRGKMKIPF